MATMSPRDVVIRYVEAVRDGDADVVRDSFAPDATWHFPGDLPISQVWRGRAAIVDDFLGGMGPLLVPGTLRIELVGTIAEGDRVVAEWTSTATTVHGTRYHNRCAGIFTVRDGRIASVVEYADTGHVAAALFPDRPPKDRTVFSSGSPWEPVVGYSRAVRVGPFISVSGTSASGGDGVVGGDDAGQQATEIFNRLGAALRTAGASLGDVVRTRVYLTDMADFDAVARAHAAVFGDIRPATTFLQVSALAGADLLVEVEADAIVANRI